MNITWLRPFLVVPLLLVAARVHALPREGTRELRIGNTYVPPTELSSGFLRTEPEHGSGGISSLGLGAGLGFFVADNFELGASAQFAWVHAGSEDLTGPGLNPFLRVYGTSGKIGFFGELDGGVLHLSANQTSQTIWNIGASVGLELFVTDDWAIRLAPVFRHYFVNHNATTGGLSTASDESANQFGITWGLAAYF